MTKPVVAVVGAALVSGVTMFALGAKTTQLSAFQTPEMVQTVDGGYVPASQVSYPERARFASAPASVRAPRATATRTVYRAPAPALVQERVVTQEEAAPSDGRTWKKTAMIIGGSAASGAGVGGIVNGKKGALIGAAIGGGAASIYEAIHRN
jgi:hypothetical protein